MILQMDGLSLPQHAAPLKQRRIKYFYPLDNSELMRVNLWIPDKAFTVRVIRCVNVETSESVFIAGTYSVSTS